MLFLWQAVVNQRTATVYSQATFQESNPNDLRINVNRK
jgi:hypothetical protein